MKRRTVAAGILALAGAALVAGPALAQGKAATLRIGWTSTDSPQDPYGIAANLFKQKVEALVPGKVQVNLFPNRQIGDEKELLEGMRFGTVDMGVITNAVVANLETGFQVNDLPFLYADEAQAHRVLDGPVGQELKDRLAKKGVIALGFMEGGFRNMINNKRPVVSPDDVKGVKYRVMQNPVFIDMFSSLGGNAVPMAWAEVFTAVQQGAIDGLEIPVAVIDATKYYEITKYLSLTNHTYSMIALLVSKRSFDKLPKDVQEAVRKAGAEATVEQRRIVGAQSQKIIADLGQKGMQVNKIGNPAQFRQSVKPVYEKFRPSIGSDLLDKVVAAVQ
ncbi:TRAP transporter substrate-binding protein [Stella sp.]|uniref:TRAP transporter substrate-binding protein n=1 Tax=Stella sp. TaxID=2912054 RepID=UPI0035AFC894